MAVAALTTLPPELDVTSFGRGDRSAQRLSISTSRTQQVETTKTAIELFLVGIRGWEVEAGRVRVGATDSKQLERPNPAAGARRVYLRVQFRACSRGARRLLRVRHATLKFAASSRGHPCFHYRVLR